MHKIKIPNPRQENGKQPYQKLEKIIKDYKGNKEKTLTIEVDGFMRFALPENMIKYGRYYEWASNYQGTLSDLLIDLKYFDYFAKGGFYSGVTPTFHGSMEKNFIKFEGECYRSLDVEFFITVFSWLELYLESKPEQITVEFWMNYYNTSASRKLTEFMEILEDYQLENDTEIKVLWYYLDDETKEDGEIYRDKMGLDIEIIKADERVWRTKHRRSFIEDFR